MDPPRVRWNRKAVREYAPYTRWDWADPMHGALDRLSPSDCELFKSRYWDRMSYDDIGRECGVSGSTVTAHLSRICEDVARMMG